MAHGKGTMKKVMVATDFSERSDRALRRATLLAKQHGAEIVLLHVVDNDHPRRIVDRNQAEAESLLRTLALTISQSDGVSCSWKIKLDAPHAGILKAAEEEKPDLLVLGPYRRQLLKEVFAGTTSERAIRAVDCPVLVVNGFPVGDYAHILLTTDVSDLSGSVLKHFSELGLGAKARNTLTYIFPTPALRLLISDTLHSDDRSAYLEDERRAAAAELSAFLSASGLSGTVPLLRPDLTSPAHEVLKAAKDENADLIVLAMRGRSGLSKLVLGSVAEHALRYADADVLAIPPSAGAD